MTGNTHTRSRMGKAVQKILARRQNYIVCRSRMSYVATTETTSESADVEYHEATKVANSEIAIRLSPSFDPKTGTGN